MSHFYTPASDKPQSPREVLSLEEGKAKIEQMKINRERRKQGLPPITLANNKKDEDDDGSRGKDNEGQGPPALSKRVQQETLNSYQYAQQKIQSEYMHFQAERLSTIAQEARKEKHIVYQFPENPQPPKLGEKRNTTGTLIPIDIYYNEIPNEIYYELDKQRAQVSDLQTIKALQTPSYDSEGRMSPPVYTKNDPNRTGITDKVYAKISEEIDRINKDIAAKTALWVYGIPKDLLPKLDTSSLSNALEAALYRQMYGIANNTSKNSAIS